MAKPRSSWPGLTDANIPVDFAIDFSFPGDLQKFDWAHLAYGYGSRTEAAGTVFLPTLGQENNLNASGHGIVEHSDMRNVEFHVVQTFFQQVLGRLE